MGLKKFLFFSAALLGLSSPVAAQQTQCVSNALAGGTVDAIVIPLQPCALSTNLLILTAAGANTVANPTLRMTGYPALPILTSTGTNPGIGAIPGAGAVLLLTSTGSSWKIVSGNASTVFSGVLTVPNGGTGLSTITTNGIMIGQGTGNVSVVSPGTTGQFLGGNTGSPPSFKDFSSNVVTSLSFGSTGLTPSSATQGAITVAGTLAVANGGTGQSSYTDGQLLIGNSSGGGLNKTTLTAGANMIITNGGGTITLASTGVSSGCGTLGSAGELLTDNGSGGCTSNATATYTANNLTIPSLVLNGSTALTSASGDGASVVTTTGAQTSGRCVQIDANGNHVAASVQCAAGISAVVVQNSNFNASANSAYCVDTSGGTVTMTLPASPSNNDQILFIDCESSFATNAMTVNRNGNTIMGLAENMTVNTANASSTLIWVSSANDWRMH